MASARPALSLRLWERLRVPAALGEAQRIEDAVAVARCVVAASTFLLTFVEPVTPAHGSLARLLLVVYVIESLAVLAFLRNRKASPIFRSAVHILDVGWAVFVTTADTGSGSVFFLLFVFVLLSAALQWGLRGTMWTAVGGALVLLLERMLVVSISSGGRELWRGTIEEESLLVRLVVLFVFGLIFGYLANKEEELRAETSLAKAMDRALVARELHDGAIQSLIGLEVNVDVLRRQADQSPLAEELARIQTLLRREVLNLRELMQQMKPIDLSPDQLLDFLAESVDTFWRETGISARFVSDLREVALAPAICQELARIAREALVNIRKHSGARNVVMRFEFSDNRWRLIVDDDGHGFDFSGRMSQSELDAARKGPVVIKERVRSIGGELTIESTKGRGSRLEITLPERRSGVRDRRNHAGRTNS
jgi:signal transduction histidine kinase